MQIFSVRKRRSDSGECIRPPGVINLELQHGLVLIMKFVLQNTFRVLLIGIVTASAASAMEKLPRYELSVSVEPEKGRIRGTARITIHNGIETVVSMGKLKPLSLQSLRVD